MNYIKRLQQENEEQKATIDAMKGAIIGFRRHLNSSKFHEDTTIQVSDVHNWLDIVEGKDEMTLMDKSNNAEPVVNMQQEVNPLNWVMENH